MVREQSAELLVEHVAARINQVLVEAQEHRGRAGLVLSGGPLALATVRVLAASTWTAQFAPDWSHVDVWWCDELFLPQSHEQRHVQRAGAAAQNFMLLNQMPPENIHHVGASDQFSTAQEAAHDYLAELKAAAEAAGTGGDVPTFDVALLEVDAHAHVGFAASGSAQLGVQDPTVFAVPNLSEADGDRITMSLPLISTAEHVWLLAADADQQQSAQRLLWPRHDGPTPAAGLSGRKSTVLFTTADTVLR